MTFWRITIIYILSLLFVGLLVPYDDPRLVGGSYGKLRQHSFLARNVGADINRVLKMPTHLHSSWSSSELVSPVFPISSMPQSPYLSYPSACLVFTLEAELFSLWLNKATHPNSSHTLTRPGVLPGLFSSLLPSSLSHMQIAPMSVPRSSIVSLTQF